MKVGDVPAEYMDLMLCRDVYHCTPTELDGQDWARVAEHLICLDVEAKVRKASGSGK